MHPNLHVLLPSSTPAVLLEARIYLPRMSTTTSLASILSMNSDSEPVKWDAVDKEAVRALKLNKVVTAAHPWGRLGGNMLFPVISHHLPAAVYGDTDTPAAIATFNVRGIGKSGGSQPWPGLGIGNDADDFAAVESAVLDLLGRDGVEVYRLGYSYGTNLALNAPLAPGLAIKRLMLVSPAPTLFKAMTALRGPTFQQGLDAALDRAQAVQAEGDRRQLWEIFGTSDDFTGADTLRRLGGARADLVHKVEIEGCGHFFMRPEDGIALRGAIADWISGR